MTELKNLNTEFSEEGIDIDDDLLIEAEQEDIEPEKEEEITEPFDPTKIRVDTRPTTIDLVLSRIQYGELDLAPEFQRRDGIWTNAAKSRLIESILIRIPLPAFYMDATDDDKWFVVDGLQRLTALKQFVLDKFGNDPPDNKQFRLTGLEFLTHLDDKTYDQLPRNLQRRIRETQITVYLIEKGTPPEVKFNIFRRINTGGLPLSAQEIRHALNQGKATRFLSILAELKEFQKSTGMTKRSKNRMEDHEFVLRFLAFTLTPYKEYKSNILDTFLNNTMTEINKMSNQKLEEIKYNFIRAMNAAHEIFGKYAFRKIATNSKRKYPLNKALFEVWSVTLSKLSDQELQILKIQKQYLIDKFLNLLESDEDFQISISQSTGKMKTVNYRFSKIEKLLQEIVT